MFENPCLLSFDITTFVIVSNLLTIIAQISYLIDLVQISENFRAVTRKTVIFLKVRVELTKNNSFFFNFMNLNAGRLQNI